MVARLVCIAALASIGLADAASARADWLHDICHSFARDFKRRNCWPEPFQRPDRYAARAPFVVMVSNGWRIQNMLGDYHFVDERGTLNEAGRRKVRWIATEAPRQHRQVYVHRAEDAETTAERVEGVQQLVAQLLPNGPLPPVFETDVTAPGWPAARVDAINRQSENSQAAPRIPFLESGEKEE